MSTRDNDPLLDDSAGPLIRPYYISGGRTTPSATFDVATLIWSTGRHHWTTLDREQGHVVQLCANPLSVAEISAHMKLPLMTVHVLVSDLMEIGAVQALSTQPNDDGLPDDVLERVLAGLRRL